MSEIKSKSERFLEKKGLISSSLSHNNIFNLNGVSTPQVSPVMAKSVSQYRKDSLAEEVKQGLFKDGTSNANESGLTSNSYVTASVGRVKNAQVVSSNYRGGDGDTVKQSPDVYSPLWLDSNLSLPRDRPTINAWCRSFYALNPFVHNAINLHSTYPISKLNIKCANKEIERFFNEMIEETDLMNICVQIAQEFWLLGEAFVYAELDESKGKWSRLVIQNPDHMLLKRTVIASEPLIMLKPDENLKRIVFSNKPRDLEQKKQLNQHIIDCVKRGENIALDNYNTSHLARRISPYEIRGTGLPVCIFRQLALFDKLRECYSHDTEVLTDHGFKTIDQLVYKTSNIQINENYVNGVELDEFNKISSILTMKEDFKVACVNPETNNIEYHKPIELHMSKYNGEMIHFSGKKIDCLVSPNHNMWTKESTKKNFEKIKACNLLDKKVYYKFLSKANYVDGINIDNINVLNKDIPAKLYLKVLGYLISEGCVYTNYKNNRYDAFITVSQATDSDCYLDMKDSFEQFAKLLNKNISNKIIDKNGNEKEKWECRIYGKDITQYFKDQIGVNGNTISINKHIPRSMLNLNKELSEILLDALVKGDGTESLSKYNTGSKNTKYSTISKQLADDIYELVYKCGYVPNICISDKSKKDKNKCQEYIVMWSDTNYGNEPVFSSFNKSKTNNGGGAKVNKVNYNGIVWCFEVPTGLFITRRNGKITIQGNSKFAQAANMINPMTIVKIGSAEYKPTYADLEAWRNTFESAQNDRDFKIFTHEGVTVERVGYNQGIYDISGDITQLIKEIFIGLQVPQVLMDGGADTTYANGGVALDTLRQRYMEFRNMMAIWLKRKIFAPISKIQGFYDYSGGEKRLIVPEVDWNHMSLFDSGDYINNLITLTQGQGDQKRASLHSLYRSMGLEFEDEIKNMKKEAIQNVIFEKEKVALQSMSLNELRSLDDDDDEIAEADSNAAGATPSGGDMGGGGLPGEMSGGLPGLDMGAPSGAPSGEPPPPV